MPSRAIVSAKTTKDKHAENEVASTSQTYDNVPTDRVLQDGTAACHAASRNPEPEHAKTADGPSISSITSW